LVTNSYEGFLKLKTKNCVEQAKEDKGAICMGLCLPLFEVRRRPTVKPTSASTAPILSDREFKATAGYLWVTAACALHVLESAPKDMSALTKWSDSTVQTNNID
jgi:hypothetical protein